ncbi:fibroblast growth factor 6-like protein [Lates japonicus]|uniref:Fibroblast growth factor 6-like protein n=1 Tax=Lates japonicus TaxID=270547 RepID=A0AAD3NCU8_LATJO|nr:fibroblast growth factor 6-like protein [Lates japonicus]
MIIATGTNSSSDALCPSPPAQISGYGALICLDPKISLYHHHHAKGQKIRRVAFLGQVTLTTCPKGKLDGHCAKVPLQYVPSGARTHWTLPAVILLWTSLWGIVSSYPIPSRTNATLLEKKWETLFSRSYLGILGGNRAVRESTICRASKRWRLYCNVNGFARRCSRRQINGAQ